MKIKQVEELVGITRKNIRFYEDQGLLNVERAENGYREYHTADIARLQEIKLFRKMDISIEEMRALLEKPAVLSGTAPGRTGTPQGGPCENAGNVPAPDCRASVSGYLECRELSGRNRADGERGCKVYGYKENRYP